MTSDPGTARRAPRRQAWLHVACPRAIRHDLMCRVLPPGWVIWMTVPFREAAAGAGAWPGQAR